MSTSTSDSAEGEPIFRRIVEQRVDAGRQREDAPGQPDDRLRAEQSERVDEGEQRAREDRGGDERRGDGERGAQLACAEDLRRLLVGGVDRKERARGEQVDEREGVHTVTSTSPDMVKMLKVSQGSPATSRISTLTSPALGLNR